MPEKRSTKDAAASEFPLIRVFGGMGIGQGDGPVSVGGPKLRRLLALLVVRSGSTVSLDWLEEHLWDDDERPEPTTPTLRTYIARLRRSLAQDWIETEASGYRFTAPDESVEHRRFAMLRAEASRARDINDPQNALNFLDEALALWRGDPFRELEDLDWARADIEQLKIDRLEMLEERWDAVLALGRHTQITGELAAFTAEHGLRDRAARQFALALHRSGRTTEALRVIDEHRRTLADQSGLEPSSEIVELEDALLRGDASLTVEKTGRPLRGYRLIEEIGSGAFSVVWRGVQPSVNRDVAVKQIRAELASQPEFIRRFEAEAQLVARIEHPHIVPMIDFWRDPDSAYLVMRWLRGGTLEQRLDDGPMAVEATLTLARQIGGALSAAHARGVVHRDVKAANILFDEDGHAFLTDFGIALDVAEAPDVEVGVSQGSPAYASPEQIRHETLGPRADLFSLGVVIFECMTGSLPFRDSSSLEHLVKRQLHAPFPLLSEWRSDVPAAIVEAVAKATAKDPAARFASVGEFVDALESGDVGQRRTKTSPQLSDDLENPYKGLRAFDDGDSDQFFGRERLTAELIDHLGRDTVASRCLVVVGPSGSGKSSIVRAGLAPALRAGAVDGSADWFSTVMVPGVDPFESLEAALLRIAVNPPPSLLSQLRDGERGVLRGIRRCLASEGQTVLVVIDQFEEIFTGASSEDANAFLDALAIAVDEPSSPLRLIATLRADYYHRPLEHTTFAPILKRSAVEVTPMAGDELERAIVKPAEVLGINFEEGLVSRIAADAAGQRSPLPLLQYTLSELFDRRIGNQLTASAYDEIGGLSGALSARAEAIHAEASEPERVAIRRIFGRMTNPGEEAADLRRRVPVGDLGDDASTQWVLDRFGSARLITFDRDVATREPTVEVAHEALLREWPRLVAWLDEDADLLRSADAVADAATAWDESGRTETDLYRGGRLDNAVDLALTGPDRLRPIDNEFIDASRASAEKERGEEQRRVRRLRRLAAGVGVALVFALVAAGVAVDQQRRANEQADRAEAQTELAEAQTEVAEREASTALAATEQAELATLMSRSAAIAPEDQELAMLLALEAHRRMPGAETEQVVMSALGASTLTTRVSRLAPVHDVENCDVLIGDGVTEFGLNSDGTLISVDVLTGQVVEHGPSPTDCGGWFADFDENVRWAGTVDGDRWRFGPADGPWTVETEFDEPTFGLWPQSIGAGWVAGISFPGDRPAVTIFDAETGSPIGEPIVGRGEGLLSVVGSPDGSLIALAFGTFVRSDGDDGETVVVDTSTGEVLLRVDSARPAGVMAFDTAANELVAADIEGSLMTIDLESGEIVAEVPTDLTSDSLDVGIALDGLVVVVTLGEVGWIDRRSGPTGRTVELRDVSFARYRPDGRLYVANATETEFGVLDLDGSALIDRSWEIDPFSQIAFNADRAATNIGSEGDVEVIELETGERTIVRPVDTDGTLFPSAKPYPETDGIVAISQDGIIVRTVGNDVVERIELDQPPSTGTRYEDWWALVGDGVATLVNVARGELEATVVVDAPDVSTAHPTGDGGMYVFLADGTLRTYDSVGVLTNELSTGAEDVFLITFDPASGKLALANLFGSSWIVDLESGDVQLLAANDLVVNLGFARNGELLALTSPNGTIRLWDVARGASAGVIWDGSGAVVASPNWYDEETESLWATSSGKLLQIPLNPDRWIAAACDLLARDLTQAEWDQFVPGEQELQSACE
jgi:serine/threonine protein kinase/WD40 repeat protein/DNA-binding winged helix-turn-helix (wHTH) protein